jgi:hypothetical protein
MVSLELPSAMTSGMLFFFKKYGERVLLLVLVPLILSLSLAPFVLLAALDVVKVWYGFYLVVLIFIITFAGKWMLFYRYSAEYVSALVPATLILCLAKSEKFRNSITVCVERKSKRKIEAPEKEIVDSIYALNQEYKKPNYWYFGFCYVVMNFMTYTLFFLLSLTLFFSILSNVAATNASGLVLTFLLLLALSPLALLLIIIFYLDYLVVRSRDSPMIAEVFTDKDVFIGSIMEENDRVVRIVTTDLCTDVELPENITTHLVEIEIPRSKIELIKVHDLPEKRS